jgi:uncharacterized membrane protein
MFTGRFVILIHCFIVAIFHTKKSSPKAAKKAKMKQESPV